MADEPQPPLKIPCPITVSGRGFIVSPENKVAARSDDGLLAHGGDADFIPIIAKVAARIGTASDFIDLKGCRIFEQQSFYSNCFFQLHRPKERKQMLWAGSGAVFRQRLPRPFRRHP